MNDENRRSDKRESSRPFFARFLEGQDYPRVKTDLKGGRVTKPSSDLEQTMKAPSDNDEI